MVCPTFYNGHEGATFPTNKWVALQVKEVSPRKFLVHDLDNSELTSSISNLYYSTNELSS